MLIINLKSAVLLFLISMLFAITACSSVDNNNSGSETPQEVNNTTECMRGFISPPGVNECLRIDDILAGDIKIRAPKGLCPKNWQKHSRSGLCLPAYQLVPCGTFTFACDSEKGDTFKVVKGEPKCKDGNIVVTVPAPDFDHDTGLYLGTTTTCLTCGPPRCLTCGPPSRHDPVPN